MITQDYLRRLLNYDPETGIFTWKINPTKRIDVGSVAGCISNGYLVVTIKKVSYKCHRLAWLYIYGYHPKDQIDHINGIRNDNRLSNLREASKSQNSQNHRKPQSNNTSGYLGVSWINRDRKFIAQIAINGKNKNLGYFDNAEDAYKTYLEAKRKHHEYCTI